MPAMTAIVKSWRGSICVRRTSDASTASSRSANARHEAQLSRCDSTRRASRAGSSPSRSPPILALHAEQFTAGDLRWERRVRGVIGRALGLERARERCFAPMDERLDVAERDLHRVGYLLIFHVFEVTQRERGSHLLWYAQERVADAALVVCRERHRLRCGLAARIRQALVERLVFEKVLGLRAAALFAQVSPRDVAGDLVQPGRELRDVRVEGP